jgi:hypothetical protein
MIKDERKKNSEIEWRNFFTVVTIFIPVDGILFKGIESSESNGLRFR